MGIKKVVEYQVSKADEHGDMYDVDHCTGRGSKKSAIKKAKEWRKDDDSRLEKVFVERLIRWIGEDDAEGEVERKYEDVAEFEKEGE